MYTSNAGGHVAERTAEPIGVASFCLCVLSKTNPTKLSGVSKFIRIIHQALLGGEDKMEDTLLITLCYFVAAALLWAATWVTAKANLVMDIAQGEIE